MSDKTITIAGVELPVNIANKHFIPGDQRIIGSEDELKKVAFSAKNNLPMLMIGETGVGKTSLIRYVAKQTNNGFRRLNLNGQTTVDEFVGKVLLDKSGTYWQDGVLIDAMRNGYWLLLDEINAALPEILFVLHSLLDDDRFVVLAENKGEIVRPHKNFRVFATMNPTGKYTGTKELNKAFLSRFPIVVQVDFPPMSKEKEIIASYAPKAPKNFIENLVRAANDLRITYQKDEIEFLCSTRDLINCAQMAETIGIDEAIKMSILNRCQPEDAKAVNTVIGLYFGKANVVRKVFDYEVKYNEITKRLKEDRKEMWTFAKDLEKHAHEQRDSINLLSAVNSPTVKKLMQSRNDRLVFAVDTWLGKLQKELEA